MIDGAFMSHVVLWFLTAMGVVGAIGVGAALFSLGRAGNRKD